MGSQVVNLKASGLQTYYQSLMEISPGALLQANNTIINRSGVIEPRRGFKTYGPQMLEKPKQLFQYRNKLIRHSGTTLSYDNGEGTFTDFIGSYSEPISGYRIKSVSAKSNIYFTTNESVKKISKKSNTDINSQSIENVGVPKAFSGSAICNFFGDGFLPIKGTTVSSTGKVDADYYVAYRVLWTTTDDNDNLLLGSPSDRMIASNLARIPECSVDVSFPIPLGITTKYKYRIYRSEVAKNASPSDELKMVYEANPTSTQITTGSITYTDRVKEEVRGGGVPLYTNELSGEGGLKANDVPPSALDIALFNGHMFYANTKVKEFVEVELRKLKDANTEDSSRDLYKFTSGVSDLIFSDGVTTNRYIYEGERHKVTLTITGGTALTGCVKETWLILYSSDNSRRYTILLNNTSSTQITSGVTFASTSRDLELGYNINTTLAANAIANNIRAGLYGFSSGIYDFDVQVVPSTGTINITYNSNGATLGVTKSQSTNTGTPFNPVVSISTTTIGKGEDIVNKKILLSNGFSPTYSSDAATWTAGSNTITIGAGGSAAGFVVGGKLQCGTDIPEGAFITAISGSTITISEAIAVASNGNRVLVQLSNKDNSIEETCKSTVRVINNDTSSVLYAYYTSTSSLSPGKMLFERRTFIGDSFYIGTSDLKIYNFFTPEIGKVSTNTSLSIAPQTLITVSTGTLGLSSGDSVIIYEANSSSSINGIQTVVSTGPLATQYTINKQITSVVSAGKTLTTKLKSSNEKSQNRIYYSKDQEPESVPILNYVDVGSKDFEISRIISSRDSLFILKKDGVFRLTGEGGRDPVWSVSSYDNTVIIMAPDSAVVLANDCYFLSNQGYVKLNESALTYISAGIENKLLPFVNSGTNIHKASFSIPYESDRSLLAWTILNRNDTEATVCYRFNIFTQTWTEWKITKTCGILNPSQDKLYLGATDNYIEVERKGFNRYDYADREIDLILNPLSIDNNILKLDSYEQTSAGDVLTQTQYVTIYQFNSLLKKLDKDYGFGIGAYNFYADLVMQPGDSLTSKMSSLVLKLDAAEGSPIYSPLWTSSTDFQVIQTQFNSIVNALNLSSKAIFSNYKLSTDTVTHEIVIESVDLINEIITLSGTPSFMEGIIRLYKAIPTEVEYAPQHAGDVAGFKQFSYGNFMFERRSFRHATVSYNSDISDGYESIPINLDYSGSYGTFTYGEDSIWGGRGDQAVVSTYIPLKKQKCRFLGCKFAHNTAFESFQLYGISMSVRLFQISDRKK